MKLIYLFILSLSFLQSYSQSWHMSGVYVHKGTTRFQIMLSVSDEKGKPVKGLKTQNFKVTGFFTTITPTDKSMQVSILGDHSDISEESDGLYNLKFWTTSTVDSSAEISGVFVRVYTIYRNGADPTRISYIQMGQTVLPFQE
jgi:hypothetical protein